MPPSECDFTLNEAVCLQLSEFPDSGHPPVGKSDFGGSNVRVRIEGTQNYIYSTLVVESGGSVGINVDAFCTENCLPRVMMGCVWHRGEP